MIEFVLTAENKLDVRRQRCWPDCVGENYFPPSAQNVMTHCRADSGSLIASQISVRHEKRFDLTFFLAAGFHDCDATWVAR